MDFVNILTMRFLSFWFGKDDSDFIFLSKMRLFLLLVNTLVFLFLSVCKFTSYDENIFGLVICGNYLNWYTDIPHLHYGAGPINTMSEDNTFTTFCLFVVTALLSICQILYILRKYRSVRYFTYIVYFISMLITFAIIFIFVIVFYGYFIRGESTNIIYGFYWVSIDNVRYICFWCDDGNLWGIQSKGSIFNWSLLNKYDWVYRNEYYVEYNIELNEYYKPIIKTAEQIAEDIKNNKPAIPPIKEAPYNFHKISDFSIKWDRKY